MSAIGRRFLGLLLVPSIIVSIAAVLLTVGISETAYETKDSLGRPMAFNDRLSPEHYLIIPNNFSWSSFVDLGNAYDWLLLGMHLTGLIILLLPSRQLMKLEFWFFASQPFLFPFAIFGIPIIPWLVGRFLSGRLDREDVIDIPFVWCTAHPVWVLTSVAVALLLRGQVIGELWSGLRGQRSA